MRAARLEQPAVHQCLPDASADLSRASADSSIAVWNVHRYDMVVSLSIEEALRTRPEGSWLFVVDGDQFVAAGDSRRAFWVGA